MNGPDDRMIALHESDDPERFLGAVVPPVFMNSLHVFPTMQHFLEYDPERDYMYGRTRNPTVEIVEKKLAGMERGERAILFSSGMAAFTAALLTTCRTGDHIVCLHSCYGPVSTFLQSFCVARLNMTVTYVKTDVDAILGALRPETSLILLESPTSLVFDVLDLAAVTDVARARGIRTYIDNTYCTPLYQKPLEHGMDLVMHTLSKYIGGHSDLIGGALVCRDPALGKALANTREQLGSIMGPQEAWLAMRGMRTLEVRLSRHQQTALAVAQYLENHQKVRKVRYPGLPSHPGHALAKRQQMGSCGLLSFELRGSVEEAMAVCNRLKVFQIGVSWGGFESLVVMPMLHRTDEEAAACGTERSLIRIHCGLEGEQVLIEDLAQALEAVKA